MIKKVLVESDGFVSHIFHDDSWQEIELQEGQTIEEREYEQLEDVGWYPKGQIPITSDKRIENLELENADLFMQNAMQDVKISTLEDENAQLLLIVAGGM